jgi:hypothetical protein
VDNEQSSAQAPNPLARCKYCDQEISGRAKICFHCSRPQKWWKVHHLELASLVGVVLSIALFIVGALQYADARKDRIEAAEALKKSTAALSRASTAESKLDSQRVEINLYSEQLFSSICEISGGDFITATNTCQLPDGRAIKYEAVFRSTNTSSRDSSD